MFQDKKKAVLGVSVAGVAASASAAVPAGVESAIQGAASDMVTVGGYIIVALAGLLAFRLIARIMS